MTTHRLILQGFVPGKKNLLKRGKHGGLYRDKSVQKQIDALTHQAKCLWQRPPAHLPEIRATFFCRDERSDLDNKWTTVLDCLVKARVLSGDNLKRLPGPITYSGRVDLNERVEIEIVQAQKAMGA